MRGKVPMSQVYEDMRGITPAYAGKRLVCVRLAVLPQDHPRLCGEKRGCGAHLIIEKGSPPPMRGKAEGGAGSGCCRRITPAYAGKSFFSMHRHYKCQDHPRLCGEKIYFPF